MSAVDIPDELLSRAQILADTEGVSLEAFIIRCVDDAVTHMEAADAELDAADEAMSADEIDTSLCPGLAAVLDSRNKVRIGQAQPEPEVIRPRVTMMSENPDPRSLPGMVYQSKSQVLRDIQQARSVPLRESAALFYEQIQGGASLHQQRTAEIEAERQSNQQKLKECRRQTVEGMKRMLGKG
jgi:predicted HicB family RNase H-like nuclease